MQTTLPSHTIKLNPDDYAVAWIAPLEIEAQAALQLLDRRHPGRFPVSRGNDYVYHAGSMGGHNIVIATLPAGQEYGTGSAAALASQVKIFFPNLWFGLLVGVAAGLPNFACSPERDIRLGDVLVGLPDGESAGLVAYDLGKETEEGFQLLRDRRTQAMTESIVRSAISSVKLRNDVERFLIYYNRIRHSQHGTDTFSDPGQDNDILYMNNDDGLERIAHRPPRPDVRRTRVWYGPIGSGDKLIRNARKRDELRDRYGIIGLEMEAAGTMNRIPVGVIRGVCDYGDRHKNKLWQPYAAAMAASYARALLDEIPPRDVYNSTYHVQFPKNSRFTGRTTILQTLEEKLFGNLNSQKLALFGLGGVGKTQIAVQFMHRVKESQPDCSIFLVSLLNLDSAEQAFYKIAQKLGLEIKDEEQDIKEAVYIYLNTRQAGKWLLVLDNVDDRAVISGSAGKRGLGEVFFSNAFPVNAQGRILITTRFGHIATEFAGPDVIEVEQMSLEEATELFERYLVRKPQPGDGPLIVKLLERLVFLPLAITQAASYLNQSKAPIRKYLSLLDETKDTIPSVLGRDFKDMHRQRGSENAIGTVWFVSFRQIEQFDSIACSLLSFLSYIEPRAICQDMLPGAKSDAEKTEWALGTLCAYSFITRRGETDIFDMHNLVQKATRGWIEVQGRRDQVMADTVYHVWKLLYSVSQSQSRELCKLYLPHALQLLEHHPDEAAMDRSYLHAVVGHCLAIDRQFHDSVKHHELACQWAKSNLAETNPSRLNAESALGNAYIGLQRPKPAIKILEGLVQAIQKATFPGRENQQLRLKHGLACAYLLDKRHADAINIFKYLVTVRETLDEEDPIRLQSEVYLAHAYYEGGYTDEAIKLFECIVATQKNCLEKGDRTRLNAELQLAKAYLKKDGRLKDAIALFETTALNAKQELHPTNIFLFEAQTYLAQAYLLGSQLKKVVETAREVIATPKDILNEYDELRLWAEFLLGKAYLEDGKYVDAIKLLEPVVPKFRKSRDQDDTLQLESEIDLAKAYLCAGQIKDAINIFERLLPILKSNFEEAHNFRLAVEHGLGKAYCQIRRFKDGIPLLEHSVAILKRQSGRQSSFRQHAEYDLAMGYFGDNRIDEAYEAMKEAIRVERDLLPEDHPRRRKMEADYDMICRAIYERD